MTSLIGTSHKEGHVICLLAELAEQVEQLGGQKIVPSAPARAKDFPSSVAPIVSCGGRAGQKKGRANMTLARPEVC